MVVEVRYYHVTLVVETHASRGIEMLPQCPLEAVLVDEVAVSAEELDTMVASVGHQDLTIVVHSNIPGVVEQAVFTALFPEFHQECAVDAE